MFVILTRWPGSDRPSVKGLMFEHEGDAIAHIRKMMRYDTTPVRYAVAAVGQPKEII